MPEVRRTTTPAGRPGRAAAAAAGLALLALLLFVPAAAAAQTGEERITAYDVEIRVEGNGSLLITETIDYDFARNERHGIYRDVPVRLRYDGRYDRVYPLKILSVEGSPGTPDEYKTENVGNDKRIRIGDPDRTITGPHRYTVTYRVEAALNAFPEHDELYWNAVGTEWSVPIERSTVRVTTPGEITAVACFAGEGGSRLSCDRAERAGGVAGFSQGWMGGHQGVTVVVGLPKGVVPEPTPVLDERWSFTRAFSATPATVGASIALLAAAVSGIAALAWRTGRDRRFAGSPVDVAYATSGQEEPVRPSLGPFGAEETPVEFVPPEGLRPGQIGTLVDEEANTLDVSATIVDLAVRGYLRIDEIPKKGWFGKPDWTFTQLKESDGLRKYERLLLNGIFQSSPEVKLSSLRNTFAARLAGVRDALYDDVYEEGWFVGRPDKIRTKWYVIGALLLAAASAIVVALAVYTHAALVGTPLVLGALLLLATAKRMPRRTAKGMAVLRRAQGFRRFIDESERDRARFAEQQHLFSEYLPYAVVFGATEKWARAFAGLDGELPETAWYGSGRSFTAASFSDSIDGFSITTAGTISSTPSGSGGSGFSGGSSGGGGGGGGGGSW